MEQNLKVFRKIFLWPAVIAVGIVVMLALVACNEEAVLYAPQNVHVADSGYLVWDEVDGADGYVVDFDGETYETKTNKLDVFDLTNFPKTYSARVMACGDLKVADDSAWSEICEYTVSIAKKWSFKLINNDSEYQVTCQDKDISGKLLFPAVGPDGKPVTAVSGAGGSLLKNVTSISFHGSIANIFPGFLTYSPIERFAVSKNNVVYKDDGNCIIRSSDDALVWGCDTSVIPDYVRSIEGGAFSGCKSLQQIDIPSGIKSIGNSAFSNCKSLKEISLPEGITSIGLGMFSGCGSLQTVKLPSTLTKLNPDAFVGCKAVDSVIIDEKNPVYKVDGNCVMRITDNAVACGFENSVIPEYAEIIGSGAFAGREMSYMNIPEGIEVIESGAFMECPYLEEVVFPSTLKKIGSAAFSDCVNLKRYRLPYGLTEIGSYAFLGCELIENPIAIPETVIKVGAGAFYGGTHYICGDELRPDGFHVPTTPGDYWWDCGAGMKCAGIVMGYDGCYPYVDTFTYKKPRSQQVEENGITQTVITYSGTYVSSYIAVPYRKGYAFAGWATERDGEVKFGIVEKTNSKTGKTYFACLFSDDIKQIADGTTLYAVWSPETE